MVDVDAQKIVRHVMLFEAAILVLGNGLFPQLVDSSNRAFTLQYWCQVTFIGHSLTLSYM